MTGPAALAIIVVIPARNAAAFVGAPHVRGISQLLREAGLSVEFGSTGSRDTNLGGGK